MTWVCDECTAVYSADAPACPQCGGTAHHNDWEEGGASSPGTSSSTSAGTRPRNVGRKSPLPAQPAPTTENPSAPDETGRSSVPSTGGGQGTPAASTNTPDGGAL